MTICDSEPPNVVPMFGYCCDGNITGSPPLTSGTGMKYLIMYVEKKYSSAAYLKL